MKWFKHVSTARNDERLSKLEDKCGLEGYGFYFKLLEIVSEVMDSSDMHERTYSLSRWGKQTNITTKKFMFLVQCCADVGLMSVCRGGDDMTVKIPKLLKHRDNYTKNLQVTYKQEVEEEVEREEKREVEVEKKEKKPKSKALAPATAAAKEKTPLQIACRKTWDSFCKAYFERHGVEPTGNRTVYSQIKAFVERIGFEDSPFVAEFYVQHNERYYVQKLHPVGSLLKDAEGLRAQWATGRSMTATRAGQIDQTQANFSVVSEVMEKLERENNAKAS